MSIKKSHLGAIYTPDDIAAFMTDWAISSPQPRVLDLGVGEGAFTFAAYNTLLARGATPYQAQLQIYGTEINQVAFDAFRGKTQSQNLVFPNVVLQDFFTYTPDEDIDVIVGNPPYVRRKAIQDIEHIRSRVLDKNPNIASSELLNLTDLYAYFLLYAGEILKANGRLCVITPDPWINVRYGKILKKYLLEKFTIERLVAIDRSIFKDAQVKTLLLFATKKPSASSATKFIRVHNGLPIRKLADIWDSANNSHPDVSTSEVLQGKLSITTPWGIQFKCESVYDQIAFHPFMTPTSKVAKTQIGYQTLAKGFFVLPPDKVDVLVESKFVRPIASSSGYFENSIISIDTAPENYLFYCSENKKELKGTKALAYIEAAEHQEVTVRGKGLTVIGYQNKDRIQRDKRPNWYDIRTHIEARTRSQILVPRFVYKDYLVLWNCAQFIPGEVFIEFVPHLEYEPEVYLAILNSTISELMFRSHAQLYGGGTNNMSPGEFKRLPMLNPELIAPDERRSLSASYHSFVENNQREKQVIDAVIYRLLNINDATVTQIQNTLENLKNLTIHSKKQVNI